MKHLIFLICAALSVQANAQGNRQPKMAALWADGYYVTQRNDTLFGEVRTNPESEVEFYSQFLFKPKGAMKGRIIKPQRAKAYGFGGRNFVQAAMEGRKVFYERLLSGRLRLLEYKMKGRENGYEAIVSEYFVRDSQADPSRPELLAPRKISKKFYKRMLKPYMADQPMIWSDLNKFEFDVNSLVQALNEFNSFYMGTAN